MSAGARVVAIDGVVMTPERATVSVYDRGFLYGDAVFEVLRTYGGRPFALDEHLARLRRSAEKVFIELPVPEATLAREVNEAIAAAGNEESYVRLMITRGSGPLSLDPSTATHPLRVLLVEPVVPPARDVYLAGIALASARTHRAVDDTSAAGAKVSNYLPNLLALREARRKGAQEVLVVDERGQVLEGATSNVFIVRGGRLATPPESAGILAGITRAAVLAAAAAVGMPCEERGLTLDEVYAADEVFITSSIRELVPVVRVDQHVVGSGVPGELVRTLHRGFRQAVGMGERPMPWEA
jgi:branched-chain amino acid aminotransferase